MKGVGSIETEGAGQAGNSVPPLLVAHSLEL